jgi:hypothetical protein
VITPMTNAVGYHHYFREEPINTTARAYLENTNVSMDKRHGSYDINRDFPYNTKAEGCLNTIAGRVVHQLFVENVFVSALTFHGGINVIGYPWGSYNHVRHVGKQDYVS